MTPAPPQQSLKEISRNRNVRSREIQKRLRTEKRARSERRRAAQRHAEELGEDAPPKKEPVTIDSARIFDEETGEPLSCEAAQTINDEFTTVLAGEVKPRVVITTGLRPSDIALDFVAGFLPVCPGATYFERHNATIAEFMKKALEKDVTDVLLVKDDKNKLSTFTHVHLPNGPTAIYKLSSFVPSKSIPGHGRCTRHTPEIILNRFTTSLGLRVGRMLGSLFPHSPNFIGRQAITFHNQRDFIFFRFHRYVFNANKDKARLQELGPRFTLKLRALQKGVFEHPDKAEHEFRWVTKTDRNRRRFFL